MIMNADCGFPIQMLKTSSNFYHCRMAFYLEGLPVELKPYIVLFQELLTETGLSIPQETTKQNLQLSYTDATRLLAEEVINMCMFMYLYLYRLFRCIVDLDLEMIHFLVDICLILSLFMV